MVNLGVKKGVSLDSLGEDFGFEFFFFI